jgi:long-chain acyl-CoA synthetase
VAIEAIPKAGQDLAGLGRVAARLSKQVERGLVDVHLSLAQYRVLANLSEGPSAASELAERLIVSRPSVTAIADGLVERGLVERRAEPNDRRAVIHLLTDHGFEVLASADEAIERRLYTIAGTVSEADRRKAFAGLHAWRKALDAVRSKVIAK